MKKPLIEPNFSRLRQVLLRQGEPERLPLIELNADPEIMGAVMGEPLPPLDWKDPARLKQHLDGVVRFFYSTGYDYVTVNAGLNLPTHRLSTGDTAALQRAQRMWDDENSGPIQSWADFEAYPWPAPSSVNYAKLEYVGKHLPDGMKIIYLGPGGQFENMAALMGLKPLALALADQPDLVQAVAERVGELLVNLFSTAAQMPGVGALWLGDDLGYKTSTVLSPRHLRQFVFPWQKKLAQIAHAHGLPFMLHSCGNLERIMDDLIDEVGIDAKHSFEDVILPVTEAKQRYGQRVAILGGIDMDYLCRHTPDEVRAYTRRVLEACAPGGGYALGTGNSVANYVPVANYLAMVEEGQSWRY